MAILWSWRGVEAGIKTAVATLGLDWDKRLVTNYLAIYGAIKSPL